MEGEKNCGQKYKNFAGIYYHMLDQQIFWNFSGLFYDPFYQPSETYLMEILLSSHNWAYFLLYPGS